MINTLEKLTTFIEVLQAMDVPPDTLIMRDDSRDGFESFCPVKIKLGKTKDGKVIIVVK